MGFMLILDKTMPRKHHELHVKYFTTDYCKEKEIKNCNAINLRYSPTGTNSLKRKLTRNLVINPLYC